MGTPRILFNTILSILSENDSVSVDWFLQTFLKNSSIKAYLQFTKTKSDVCPNSFSILSQIFFANSFILSP